MFPPMIIGAAVGSAAAYMSVKQYYRQQLGPMTLRDVRHLRRLPVTPIAEARHGLVKIVGNVGSNLSVSSYYHRTACACLELHHYEVASSHGLPARVLSRVDRDLHEFWVEDGTGRMSIDPSFARIDYEIEGGDVDSAVEERRLRVGETVVVLGVLRTTGAKLTPPMRSAATMTDTRVEFTEPPLVTWRSEPEVYPRLAPPAGGMMLSAGSVGLAILGSILNL